MAGRITELLPAYLRLCTGKTYSMGTFDCGLFVADWCAVAVGVDPMADVRGRYSDVSDALFISGQASLLRDFDARLRSVGLQRTTNLKLGDVAMVKIGGKGYGAIRLDNGFAMVGGRGGISRVGNTRVAMGWSIA